MIVRMGTIMLLNKAERFLINLKVDSGIVHHCQGTGSIAGRVRAVANSTEVYIESFSINAKK